MGKEEKENHNLVKMFSLSERTDATYIKEGWEFSLRDCGESSFRRLKEAGVRLPDKYSQFECGIKHLDSGVKFRFHAFDAFLKRAEEKETGDPLISSFPSYGSPLRQVVAHQFDCAYVGEVFIEGPGGERQSCCFSWEDMDWKTLHEQIDWMTANQKIPGAPNSESLRIQKHLETCKSDEELWQKERKKAKAFAYPVENRSRLEKRGLIYPLVNQVEHIYEDCQYYKFGNSSCDFHLVITDYGWFTFLCQVFRNIYGDERKREMNMHCNFEQNVVYREIIERQTKDFEENIFNFRRPNVFWGLKGIRDDEMCVHFHEAQQLKIQEAHMGGTSLCSARDARKYSSFTVGEWKETSLGAYNIPDDKIKSLFDNCGEKIQSIEARSGTRIQLIPLFRHPCNEKLPFWGIGYGKAPRAAYIHGSENGVECAKSCLADFLDKKGTLIPPPSSSDGVISDFLPEVAGLFGEQKWGIGDAERAGEHLLSRPV